MRRLIVAIALATIVAGLAVGPASADPGSTNTQVQYRTLACGDGNSYEAWFVGPSASFHLVGSTSMYQLSSIAISTGPTDPPFFVKQYGKSGVGPSPLVDCTYTDPQGNYNALVGFFTPS